MSARTPLVLENPRALVPGLTRTPTRLAGDLVMPRRRKPL